MGRKTRLIAGVAVVAALAGCSAAEETDGSGDGSSADVPGLSASEEAEARARAGSFEKNLEQWSTPLDVYEVDLEKVSYASLVETQECAAEQGVHKEIHDFHADAAGILNRSTFGVGIDTVENAEKWGFEPGGEPRTSPDPEQAWTEAESEIWFG